MPNLKKLNQLKGIIGLLKNAEEDGSKLAYKYLRQTHGTNLPYEDSLKKARMIANDPFDGNFPKNTLAEYPKGSLDENLINRNFLMRAKQEPENAWLQEETKEKWDQIRSLIEKNKSSK